MFTVITLEICKIAMWSTKLGCLLKLTHFRGKDAWCSLFKPQGNASDPGRRAVVDNCPRAPGGFRFGAVAIDEAISRRCCRKAIGF